MYIYGTSQIHAAQPINAPHRMTPTQGAGNISSFRGVDQLDISPEADFVAQARDLISCRQAGSPHDAMIGAATNGVVSEL